MFCNYCGRTNPDDAQFCRWCAQPVVSLASPHIPAPDTTVQPDKADPVDTGRNLWFEFLAKMNDRQLQESRSTGATSWLLIVAAATLIYKLFSRLPYFLSIPDATKNSLVIFLLVVDMASVFSRLFFEIAPYDLTTQPRLAPETPRRAYNIWLSTVLLVYLGTAGLHFYTAFRYALPSLFKWILVAIGVLWGILALSNLAAEGKKIWDARKYNTQVRVFFRWVPVSSGARLLFLIIRDLVLGIGAFVILVVYLRALNATGRDWIVPLSAGTQSVILVGIGLFLFKRRMTSFPRTLLRHFEQAILLEDLTPSEIKSRFVTQLLGLSPPEWVKSTKEKFANLDSGIKGLLDSVRLDLKNIRSIDPKFMVEREHRFKRLKKKFKQDKQQKYLALKGLSIEITDFRRILNTAKGEKLFPGILMDLTALQGRIKEMEALLGSAPEDFA